MRFAYLIMAHNRFDVLEYLLKDLDDERNDIYLHIDKKVKNCNFESLKACVKKSKLFLVKRQKVYWGSYSQIKCVVSLLKEATNRDRYDYYHFMVGVEFPIKTQDYIHNFFEKNKGKEFVGFDDKMDFTNRIKYYYPFGKYARSKNKIQRKLYKLCRFSLKVQYKLGVSRLRHDKDYYKKGYANWSITHDFASLIVGNTKKIRKEYRLTSCADEMCFHTLLYHSPYYKNVFDINDEYKSVMRYTTWNNRFNRISLTDIPKLLKTDYLFVRKIDGEDAIDVIKEILKNR